MTGTPPPDGLTPAQLAALDQIIAGQADQDHADDDVMTAPELIAACAEDIAVLAERLDIAWGDHDEGDDADGGWAVHAVLGALGLAEDKLRDIVADAEAEAGLPPRCRGCGKVMADHHHDEDGELS